MQSLRWTVVFGGVLYFAILNPSAPTLGQQPDKRISEQSVPPADSVKAAANGDAVVAVVDTGAAEKVALRYGFRKVDPIFLQKHVETTIEIDSAGRSRAFRPPTIHSTFSVQILEVAADGTATFRLESVDTAVEGKPETPPPMLEDVIAKYADLKGVLVSGQWSSCGLPSDVRYTRPDGSALSGPSLQLAVELLGKFLIPLPNEAIGKGGKWNVTEMSTSGGVSIRQETEYTFLKAEAEGLSLKVSPAASLINPQAENDQLPPGVTVTEVAASGAGTLTIHPTQPLSVTSSVKTSLVLTMNQSGRLVKTTISTQEETKVLKE